MHPIQVLCFSFQNISWIYSLPLLTTSPQLGSCLITIDYDLDFYISFLSSLPASTLVPCNLFAIAARLVILKTESDHIFPSLDSPSYGFPLLSG